MASLARQYYERHSLAVKLTSSIAALNDWNDIGTVREGFQYEKDITIPMVSVTTRPGTFLELQMGRGNSTEKSFSRYFQVNCYMETEPRAMAIADDIGDIIDQLYTAIIDPSGNTIGTIFCPNSEDIVITIMPPNLAEVKVIRWRAIIQFPIEAHYIV